MKLAIVQPYFFPYIGYWQLIHAVDQFVVYDDVDFINRGWVNRNRILINGRPAYITLPLNHSSQNKKIYEISLDGSPGVREKLIRKIRFTYGKAAFFGEVFPVIEKLIRYEVDNLSDYLVHQLQTLAVLIGIKTDFITTSRCYKNDNLSGQKRIIDICKREQASTYINPQGGLSLYQAEAFRRAGIDLRFIVMRTIPYAQRIDGFVPFLSIIDALMEIGFLALNDHFNAYDLITVEDFDAK